MPIRATLWSGKITPRVRARPFLLTDLPSTRAWFDASAITGLSDGAEVSPWTDQSGYAHDASEATAGQRPVYKVGMLNSRPVVRFDGSNDRLEVADHADLRPSKLTVFLIAKATTAPASGCSPLMKTTDGTFTDGWGLFYHAASATLRFFVNHSSLNVVSLALGLNAWHVITARYDLANLVLRIDQVQASAAFSTAITQSTQVMRVGRDIGGSGTWPGDIAEAGFCADAITDADILSVERELKAKYGL